MQHDNLLNTPRLLKALKIKDVKQNDLSEYIIAKNLTFVPIKNLERKVITKIKAFKSSF